MKINCRLLCVSFFVALLTLAFGSSACAQPLSAQPLSAEKPRPETPREEIAHAFRLLKKADRDYAGHRVKAMAEVEVAGKALGLELTGEIADKEKQWKSDEQVTEARRLLREARDKLEKKDRDIVAEHVDIAVKELDEALKVK
jgi:hypothetical protein